MGSPPAHQCWALPDGDAPAAEAQPSSALCQSRWLSHVPPQREATDYAVTSGKLLLNVYFEESSFLINQCLLRLLSIQMSFLWMSLTQNDQIFLKLLGQSGKTSGNLTAASATNSTFYRDLLTALSLCWVDSQVTNACQAPNRVVLAEVWRFLLKKQHILQVFCMFNLQKQL